MPELTVTVGVSPYQLDREILIKLDQCDESGHDFVVAPISNPLFRQKMADALTKGFEDRNQLIQAPFSPQELYLRTSDSSDRLVGLTAEWANLDAKDPAERYMAEKVGEYHPYLSAQKGYGKYGERGFTGAVNVQSNSFVDVHSKVNENAHRLTVETCAALLALVMVGGCLQVFEKELLWASYIGISAIIVPSLNTHSTQFINYARMICRALNDYAFHQLWVRVPLDDLTSGDKQQAWKNWMLLKQMCDYSSKLQIALVIKSKLPDQEYISQWFAEPIKCIVLPTTTFTTNPKGYPVLSKPHQNLVRRLLQFTSYVVIEEAEGELTCDTGNHQKFLRYLAQMQDDMSSLEKFAAGYKDYLQSPLQPLMDHLESATYATFEQDPIKYQLYEKRFWTVFQRTTNSHTGRGPLVDRSLNAAKLACRKVKVYALEKNPNAYVTLQRKMESVWKDDVTVFFGDMRFWQPPEKADILVSELLGSFGDNELSPECLDGAQRLLKDDGISIPSSYSSYLAPLSSTKLYNQVTALNGPAHFETPFVVLFDAVDSLATPQKVWDFVHPNPQLPTDAHSVARVDNHHNTRYATNRFTCPKTALVHGLAGYFDAVLYKSITLSICPETHTPGMFSWFPIYFPLKKPILVPSGAIIETHLWRLSSFSKVWYEWSISTEFASANEHGSHTDMKTSTPVHNLNGSSYWIGL
ncbi:hypothetical protein H4R34_003563 [Dimargaris verticillata]|uniref:Protein arginine N-methyltransferase n=1 Tax=Dimargaris verticillata TaxID=2761393 RepID=A0A9W8E8Y3_9FUNG|nr:hypothetical protein H4R34_003563 [Dimargaris verticillata]